MSECKVRDCVHVLILKLQMNEGNNISLIPLVAHLDKKGHTLIVFFSLRQFEKQKYLHTDEITQKSW